MKDFNFTAWHDAAVARAWIDDVTASALQHWHDQALNIWIKAGSPQLPVAADANAPGHDGDNPPFADWLLRHSPAQGKWCCEQQANPRSEFNVALNYSTEFWQCCALFINTLNTVYDFV